MIVTDFPLLVVDAVIAEEIVAVATTRAAASVAIPILLRVLIGTPRPGPKTHLPPAFGRHRYPAARPTLQAFLEHACSVGLTLRSGASQTVTRSFVTCQALIPK